MTSIVLTFTRMYVRLFKGISRGVSTGNPRESAAVYFSIKIFEVELQKYT